MAEEEDPLIVFDLLPWEDVLFRYVFPCLPLPELFQLRACSKQAHNCVSQYFTCCKVINLSKLSNRASFGRPPNFGKNICHWGGGLAKEGCYYVGNGSIQRMAVNCHELKELYLRDCHWMSKEGALVISFNCTKLERLDLSGCWELTDESIVALVLCCQGLQFLSVAKIYGIGDPAVSKIAKSAKVLKHLNLAGCWRVTDNSIRVLGEYCKSLSALQVRECRDITEISLARLRARGVKLDVQAHPWQMNAATVNYLKSLRLQPT